MNDISAHAPSPQACRPTDQTQCSTCALSYDCRGTARSANLSWPVVITVLLLGAGVVARLIGVV